VEHRHITSDADWSKVAIDSLLERGDLSDWQELYAAMQQDRRIAERVIEVAFNHPVVGSSLAIHLAKKCMEIMEQS